MTMQTQLGNAMMQSLMSLRAQKGAINIEDIGEVLERVAHNIQPHGSVLDTVVHQEITKMATYLSQAKREILADSNEQKLSDASEHLDAVIKATEEATGTILDAADAIQNLVAGVGGEKEQQIIAAVTRIYEASNFQDLTGQRINKVIKTLEYIDEKIAKLVSLFGDGAAAITAAAPIDPNDQSHLLNGPQLNAPSQDDIDALFAAVPKASNG